MADFKSPSTSSFSIPDSSSTPAPIGLDCASRGLTATRGAKASRAHIKVNVPPLKAKPHAAVRATVNRCLALNAILQALLIDWLKPPLQLHATLNEGMISVLSLGCITCLF